MIPTTSLMTVSTGSMISAASTRGVTSFLIGSVPRVLSASICSVTRMDPSCAAMPEPDASGDHEAREHGTELANHRPGDEAADVHRGPELLHLHAGLQGQHHAGEEAGEQHDPERLDPDLVHLLHEVLRVERAHEREAQRLAGQAEVLLDGAELVLEASARRAVSAVKRRAGGWASGGRIRQSRQGVCRARPCQSTPFARAIDAHMSRAPTPAAHDLSGRARRTMRTHVDSGPQLAPCRHGSSRFG
jgi:hypothetical protein